MPFPVFSSFSEYNFSPDLKPRNVGPEINYLICSISTKPSTLTHSFLSTHFTPSSWNLFKRTDGQCRGQVIPLTRPVSSIFFLHEIAFQGSGVLFCEWFFLHKKSIWDEDIFGQLSRLEFNIFGLNVWISSKSCLFSGNGLWSVLLLL